MSNIAFLFLPLALSSLPAVLPFVSPSSQVYLVILSITFPPGRPNLACYRSNLGTSDTPLRSPRATNFPRGLCLHEAPLARETARRAERARRKKKRNVRSAAVLQRMHHFGFRGLVEVVIFGMGVFFFCHRKDVPPKKTSMTRRYGPYMA